MELTGAAKTRRKKRKQIERGTRLAKQGKVIDDKEVVGEGKGKQAGARKQFLDVSKGKGLGERIENGEKASKRASTCETAKTGKFRIHLPAADGAARQVYTSTTNRREALRPLMSRIRPSPHRNRRGTQRRPPRQIYISTTSRRVTYHPIVSRIRPRPHLAYNI